jgi:hypothetical protein
MVVIDNRCMVQLTSVSAADILTGTKVHKS